MALRKLAATVTNLKNQADDGELPLNQHSSTSMATTNRKSMDDHNSLLPQISDSNSKPDLSSDDHLNLDLPSDGKPPTEPHLKLYLPLDDKPATEPHLNLDVPSDDKPTTEHHLNLHDFKTPKKRTALPLLSIPKNEMEKYSPTPSETTILDESLVATPDGFSSGLGSSPTSFSDSSPSSNIQSSPSSEIQSSPSSEIQSSPSSEIQSSPSTDIQSSPSSEIQSSPSSEIQSSPSSEIQSSPSSDIQSSAAWTRVDVNEDLDMDVPLSRRSLSSESVDSLFSHGKKTKLGSSESLAGSSGSSSVSRRMSPHSSGPQQMQLDVEEMGSSGLWVFGYGSLVWHQGFDFSESLTGCVIGFARRFWQGNVTHRGTVKQPGRVATLVEDSESIVWGQAFRVCGEAALPYLNNRECQLGGYRTSLTTFYPRCGSSPFPVLLYLATPANCHWLGEDPLPTIADQIVASNGPSGHNVEYLLRLAEFIREKVPDAKDDHLFDLEHLVRKRVVDKGLCLKTLMGQIPQNVGAAGAGEGPAQAAAARPPSPPQFSNRVPTKKLRCVNI